MAGACRFLATGVFTTLELFRALIERVLARVSSMLARVSIFLVDGPCDGGLGALDLAAALGLAGKMTGAAMSSLEEDSPTAAARSEDMAMLISGLGGTERWVDSGGNENGPRGAVVVVVAREFPEELCDAAR